MDVIHAHATCRDCPWTDRTDLCTVKANDHAATTGHHVTSKVTYQSEHPPPP